MGLRRIVLLALCAVLAFGAPFASAVAGSGSACATAAYPAGDVPCGCELPAPVSSCAVACGFAFSFSPLAAAQPDLGLQLMSDAAAAAPPAHFASRAASAAFHPPR